MHFVVLAVLVFALDVTPAVSYVYSTQSLCKTLLGAKSVNPVKTSTYALTIPLTFVKKTTLTPTKTITPAPVTTTSTSTTTTTSTVFTTPTSTFTETDTETDTSTSTITTTSTETDTATTTTTPAAVTVPTAPGFTPLASEGSYSPKKRSEAKVEAAIPAIRGRVVQERAATKNTNRCPPVGKPGQFSPAQYPTSVVCGALIEAITTTTKTYTATTIVTTTNAPLTSTVTSTETDTTTTTSTPTTISLTTTTTITISTTTTTTTTATSTTTTTNTVVAPTPTSYAACQSNNVVLSANGGFGIDDIIYNGDGSVAITQFTNSDPTVCCSTCQTTANCVGYAQYPANVSPICYIFTAPGQCNGANSFADYFETDTTVSGGSGYAVGNGACGQFADGGSDN